MSYAIVGGIGLAVGLALLVWAVRLQGLALAADRRALDAEAHAQKATEVAIANATAAAGASDTAIRLDAALTSLRADLVRARASLLLCKDPDAVKAVLDTELQAETV